MKNLLLAFIIFCTVLAPELSGSRAFGLNTGWSYSKATVLDYLMSWKSQIKSDPYLDDLEKDKRIDLVDRLAFQVDRKFSDSDLRQFFVEATWDMALTDDMAQNKVWGSQTDFLKNLSMSLRDILEPSENVLGFIRSFVEFSTLKAPKTVDEFAASRSYTNGLETETALEVSLEEAGLFASQLAGESVVEEVTPEVVTPDSSPTSPQTPEKMTPEVTNPETSPNSSSPQVENNYLTI
jgi:hypothetical protein